MNKVLIIGGGIIGLSIARELKKKGVSKITIVERGEVGKESSYAAGGMLAVHAETDKKGDFFDLCNESLHLFTNFAGELLEETGVDIELDKAGTLYLAFNKHDIKEIRGRFDWQRKAGLEIEHLSASDVCKLEPFVSPDVAEGLFFPNDWQVENRRMLAALELFARNNRIEIIENAEVTELILENGKVIGVAANSEKIFADTVIIAAGAWTPLIKAEGLQMPNIKPIRGQMISFQTAKRLFSKVIYSPRGYLIPRQDGRILAGSTTEEAGFLNETTAAGIEIIRENVLEIAPSLVNLGISDQWSGLRPITPDGFPVFDELAENLWAATGHYRNGILLAPITARLIADAVVDAKGSKYFDSFGMKRFRVVKLSN